MRIGNKYSDNRIYRGIRHYDNLPLLSEDIHEYSDTVYMKNAYIMNNIIGHGTLTNPGVSISASGIRLNEPVVLLIDGDISLIQSDDSAYIAPIEKISSLGETAGVVCIVGWYQLLGANSTLRNYGGVDNSIIENNLIDKTWDVQVSTRYQFRWMPVVINAYDLMEDTLIIQIEDRDDTGAIKGTKHNITTKGKLGNVFLADPPISMTYTESDLYIIPIIDYSYDPTSGITGASTRVPMKTKGSTEFIKSESEPTGKYIEGTTWYNPTTREFKSYIEDVGFVSSASTMGFLQYQSVHVIDERIIDSQDITVPINISEISQGDILQVTYEGLVLALDEHYTVNYEDHTATLLGFTADAGDRIVFTVTRIVEANDITNITATFTQHLAAVGSKNIRAHVRLSDSIEDVSSDETKGIAATPRAVYESKLLKDPSSGISYKIGVENGLLYIEEV